MVSVTSYSLIKLNLKRNILGIFYMDSSNFIGFMVSLSMSTGYPDADCEK